MSELKSFLHQADPEVHDPTHPISDAKIRSDVAAIVAAQPHTVMKRSQWLGVVAASAAVVVGAGAATVSIFKPITVQLDPATQTTTEATATATEVSTPEPTVDASTPPEQKSEYQFKAPRKVAPPVESGQFSSSSRTVKTPAGSVVVRDMQPSPHDAVRLIQRDMSKPNEYTVLYTHVDGDGRAYKGKVLRDDAPDIWSIRLSDPNVWSIDKTQEDSVFHSSPVDVTFINKTSWEKLVEDPESVPSLCAGTDYCEHLDEELAYRLAHNLFDAERRGYILASLAKNNNWVVSSSDVNGAAGIKFTKKKNALSSNDPIAFVVDPNGGGVRYFQGAGEEYLLHHGNVSRDDVQKDVEAALEKGAWVNKSSGSPDSECLDMLVNDSAYIECVRSVW